MNSTLKTALILGLLVAVVFGVTVISQLSVTPEKKPGESAGGAPDAPAGPPQLFRDAEIHYDPASEQISHRAFDGFFEVSDRENWVGFWFKHDANYKVSLVAKERSCVSCTSARAANVPAAVMNDYLATAAAGMVLPGGLFALPDVFSPAAAAGMSRKLEWHSFEFGSSEKPFVIPAGSAEAPALGVIALGFKARATGGPKPIGVLFEATVPGGKVYNFPFQVAFAPQPPYAVLPNNVDVGELPEGCAPRETDVFVYSTTRGGDDLPPPSVVVAKDELFMTVGKPEKMTDDERHKLAERAFADMKFPIRVKSGYRVPVTVRRDLPGKIPDIGAFDKSLSIAAAGHAVEIRVRGRMTGLVKLESGQKIDVGTYNSENAKSLTAYIYSEKLDLDLAIDMSKCEPKFCQYTLLSPEIEGSRKRWGVKIYIPKQEGRGPPWSGHVFLRASGAAVANINIPVTGHGAGR